MTIEISNRDETGLRTLRVNERFVGLVSEIKDDQLEVELPMELGVLGPFKDEEDLKEGIKELIDLLGGHE